jgi:hypothetical protein
MVREQGKMVIGKKMVKREKRVRCWWLTSVMRVLFEASPSK